MKQIVFLISISLAVLFISCEKVGKVCNVSDPLTELPWLAEQINRIETDSINVEISKVILKDIKDKKKIDAIGIYYIFNPSSHYGILSLFNCSGEGLCTIGGVIGNGCRGDYEVIKEEVIYVSP